MSEAAAETNRPLVLGVPARDAADELALRMFGNLLDPGKWRLDVLPVTALASELIDRVQESRPAVVCVASLPPGGLSHLRYLCKRLRHRFPDLKIAVGVWGAEKGAGRSREALAASGADHVAANLAETRAQLTEWLPVFEAAEDRAGVRPKVKEKVGGAA